MKRLEETYVERLGEQFRDLESNKDGRDWENSEKCCFEACERYYIIIVRSMKEMERRLSNSSRL